MYPYLHILCFTLIMTCSRIATILICLAALLYMCVQHCIPFPGRVLHCLLVPTIMRLVATVYVIKNVYMPACSMGTMEEISRLLEVQSVVAFHSWLRWHTYDPSNDSNFASILTEIAILAWGHLRRFAEYHLRGTPLYGVGGMQPAAHEEPLSRREILAYAKILEEVRERGWGKPGMLPSCMHPHALHGA